MVMLSVVMLSVAMLSVIMLSVIMLNVFMLNVTIINVIMLSVVSSSRGVFPSDLHSYSKRRFIRLLVSFSLRQWGAVIGFLRK